MFVKNVFIDKPSRKDSCISGQTEEDLLFDELL